MATLNIARWSSGSSSGSFPEGRRFESCPRNKFLSMQKLRNILITWDGLWSIPLAGVLLMYVSGLLIEINPAADVIGIGMIQDVFTAAFRLIIANTVAQVGLAINAFLFFGFTTKQVKQWWILLNSTTRLKLLLALYVAYIIAFAVMLP